MSLSRLFLSADRNPKSINELVSVLCKQLSGLDTDEKTPIQKLISYFGHFDRNENICRLLNEIKEIIYGSITSEPESERIRSQLVHSVYKSDLLLILIESLPNIPFDGQKDIALIYQYVIGQQIGTQLPSVQYIRSKPTILQQLMQYYANPQLVSICGQIIRELLRFESLAKQLFESKANDSNQTKLYLKLFDLVSSDSFAVSSDVFNTFDELLSRHKSLTKYILADYKIFFDKLNQLLKSNDYYLKRKGIHLLSNILRDRSHQLVMKRYVNSKDNLLIIKNLMESNCFYTSLAAFLVFYLFVLNPKKSRPIHDYLMKHKDHFIEFIQNFQKDRKDIKQYSREKEDIVKLLKGENLKQPSDEDQGDSLVAVSLADLF